MILLIDNYDSFTFNLYQYLAELGETVKVVRNNKITVEQIKKLKPKKIVLSPGPGRPSDAGIMIQAIRELGSQIPMLGICLGHQAIGEAFGGKVIRAPKQMHGKLSLIFHQNKGVFQGIETPVLATRYHSLIVERRTLPKELLVTAKTKDGIIMGIRHKKYPVEGVQFHPESIMTNHGKTMLRNFLRRK